MLKVIFSLSLLFSLLNGDILNDKIKNLIGERDYNIHKNLINLLLKDRYKYENGTEIKYYNLIKMVRENGLLDLQLSYPQDITIEFDLLNKNLKGYKILKDTMENIGYRYFFTDSLSSSENRLNWIIRFRAEYMLNPQILLKELQQKNCKILNIENRGFNSWYYEIDFEASKVDEAVKIDKDEKVVFQKPLKPYFLT